jgi:hypothetical protein
MKNIFFVTILALFLLLNLAHFAQATTITFDGTYNNYEQIKSGHYFQTAYDNAFVDVVFDTEWKYWNSGYNDLQGVLYRKDGLVQSAFINFVAKPNSKVTLLDFDLGNYWGYGTTTQFQVFDLTDLVNPLLGLYNIDVPNSSAKNYAVNLSSTTGFQLKIGPDIYNNGIDNIRFETAPVPEPATLLLFGLGILGIAGVGRKKLQS